LGVATEAIRTDLDLLKAGAIRTHELLRIGVKVHPQLGMLAADCSVSRTTPVSSTMPPVAQRDS
jgi:hypothetical protein